MLYVHVRKPVSCGGFFPSVVDWSKLYFIQIILDAREWTLIHFNMIRCLIYWTLIFFVHFYIYCVRKELYMIWVKSKSVKNRYFFFYLFRMGNIERHFEQGKFLLYIFLHRCMFKREVYSSYTEYLCCTYPMLHFP